MNKIANYLQEHITGDVLSSTNIRNYFATDASVLTVVPTMVVYPKNTNDVRKITRFASQLAEKGHVLPITARGKGTDQSGAAIGSGIIMAFPAYMNRLLELDTAQRLARVQPGMGFRALQDTVMTHGYFLPPYPSSIDYSTIGGAIANNTGGEKSVKYGSMRQYVESLEVVLANGELIQTGRLSKRDLNRKKGLTSFEGEVYRQLDGIITDNWELIQQHANLPAVSKNSAGYALSQVKRKDGSFDLTPLFVGSQGTLGIVTEAILRLQQYNPHTTLVTAYFEDIINAGNAVEELLGLEPSALEMVDKNLLEFVDKVAPARLKGLIEGDLPAVVLLIEFDDPKPHARNSKAKKAEKIAHKYTERVVVSEDFEEQQRLWSIRHSAATVVAYDDGHHRSLPIIEDGVVPRDKLPEFLQQVYALLDKHRLQVAVWGHAGDGNLHMQPLMDLSRLTDRQKVFKVMNDYYKLVLDMGGSTSGEHNDGRLRAPYLKGVYGAELYDVFTAVKKAFDPHGILNPGVKVDVDLKDIMPLLRKDFSLDHLADHLPRS